VSREHERKVLRALLRRMDSKPKAFFNSSFVLVVLWLPLVLLFAFGFHASRADQLHPAFLCFGSALVGMLVYWLFLRRASQRTWPLLMKYLDRSRIEDRLRELET
jgi:hypothetical protein